MLELILRTIIPGIIFGIILGYILVNNPKKYILPYFKRMNFEYFKSKSTFFYIKTTILGLILGVILIYTIPNVNSFIINLFQEPTMDPDNVFEGIRRISPIFLLLIISIFPIFEEYMFRGVLLNEIKYKTNSTIIGLIGSSFLFAIIHLSNPGTFILAIIPYFIGGLILGLFYLKYGLLVAIIGHIIYNVIPFII